MPQFAPTVSSIRNLRDMFYRNEEKMPPDLKHALSLLKIADFTGLEECLLTTTAFLRPWAVFRDAFFLAHDLHSAGPSNITRLDILWHYTQYDENVRRHDPRAEKPGSHFEIDKTGWSRADFEKHLYAWLLQTLCVGKANSPFGFRYFESRNICTAWEEVIMPIVKAVRASYSVKGRRHYGRLALFIEDKIPSRLAFPEGNINLPEGVVTSPTPFRMVSRPTHLRGASQTVLTKKNYDDTERELRDVYPQYGGLVERPRFKQKMEEWLEEQRIRAAHRKTIAKPDVVQYVPSSQPKIVDKAENDVRESANKKNSGSRSPIKRCSDSIRRSLSMNIAHGRIGRAVPPSPLEPVRPKTPDTPKIPMIPYGLYSYVPKIPKEEPKSPLHGVTRQIQVRDEAPGQGKRPPQSNSATLLKLLGKHEGLPRPELPRQQLSDQVVPIRGSTESYNSTFEPLNNVGQRYSSDSDSSIYSPMGALSAIPRPLDLDHNNYQEIPSNILLQPHVSAEKVRHPSYEGNDYHEEISLTNIHARQTSGDSQSTRDGNVITKPRGRLPAPIQVPSPYAGQLRVASNEAYHTESSPKPQALPWPGESPPKPIVWPGFEVSPPRSFKDTVSALPPPIPAKSPARFVSKFGQRSEQLQHQERVSHEMMRIVSKDNIRGALGGLSPESSVEDLMMQAAVRMGRTPSRVASPPRLETYNTHMFPRKDAHPHEGATN